MNNPWGLTPREAQVMESMVRLGVQKLIARELGIGSKTVCTFYTRACAKIGGKTNTASLLEYDRWMRGGEGRPVVCEHCNGSGHVYRKAA